MSVCICRRWVALAALGTGLACAGRAAGSNIEIDVAHPGHAVSPMLYGIFFEDINLSTDGGIYAELIRNRSFEDSDKPESWSVVASGGARVTAEITTDRPAGEANPRNLCLAVTDPAGGRAGIANDGYWGMAVRKGEKYELTFHVRGDAGLGGSLSVSLEGRDGTVYASAEVSGLNDAWRPIHLSMISTGTDSKARLTFCTRRAGTFWLDRVSLFPEKTWKGHGLRPDLCEMLAAMKPSFMRFPGGCWVEGNDRAHMYRWKTTIGDPADRKPQWNIWGYWATHGLGYHEYLQLCEDLGAEPLFCINVGMSHREVVPMDQMDEFVQDALDAIEYANGPADSKWGALRAKAGHPAPFNLKYMEIGNENGGPAYRERWPLFVKAIKAKYPDMKLIANVWSGYPKDPPPDFVDEHYYDRPEFFMKASTKYDNYDRKGPGVFVGEYAVTKNCGKGNLIGALGEAAFMTGMERNSDHVAMSCYAPLFVNLNHRKWNPDLINYDSAHVFGLPSYYVQQLFSANRGDTVLPVKVESSATDAPALRGAIGVGTWRTQAEFKDITVTIGGRTVFASDFAKGTDGWTLRGGKWEAKDGVLRQTDDAENIRAFIGDRGWSNYTLRLKARKLGGAEGFLISFASQNPDDKSWWNIGGWGNSRHGIEAPGVDGESDASAHIETGRWYDIRVELEGSRVRCFLDDKKVFDVAGHGTQSLYTSATLDHAAGEVILKTVNVSAQPAETTIDLKGARSVKPSARALVLSSSDPAAENTVDQPERVAPVATPLTVSPSFRHTFPPYSVTVMRVKAE